MQNQVMQPERQIAMAGLVMGSAFVIPDTAAMLQHPEAVPEVLFFVGGFFIALGVFFGILLAFDESPLALQFTLGGFWLLVALALAGAMTLGFLHSPHWGRRGFCIAEGLLPLAIYGFTVWGVLWARRKA